MLRAVSIPKAAWEIMPIIVKAAKVTRNFLLKNNAFKIAASATVKMTSTTANPANLNLWMPLFGSPQIIIIVFLLNLLETFFFKQKEKLKKFLCKDKVYYQSQNACVDE